MDAILVLLEAAALFGVLYLVVKKAVKDAIRESRTVVCAGKPGDRRAGAVRSFQSSRSVTRVKRRLP